MGASVAANPFIRCVRHIFWIRGKQKADFRQNPCRQSTQNAYKADFVDSRNKKMAATVEVTAIFSLALFTIQTSKVPAEGNMM